MIYRYASLGINSNFIGIQLLFNNYCGNYITLLPAYNYQYYYNNFILYNYYDCTNFIKKNFDLNIFNAYMSINDVYGAMKAE